MAGRAQKTSPVDAGSLRYDAGPRRQRLEPDGAWRTGIRVQVKANHWDAADKSFAPIEVIALKVSDIDSTRVVIRVEQGKGRKDRSSPPSHKSQRHYLHSAPHHRANSARGFLVWDVCCQGRRIRRTPSWSLVERRRTALTLWRASTDWERGRVKAVSREAGARQREP
jgi:integrase